MWFDFLFPQISAVPIRLKCCLVFDEVQNVARVDQSGSSQTYSFVPTEMGRASSHICIAVPSVLKGSSSVLLYVHRDHKDRSGRGAQDGHLDFHTAPEL